VRISYNDIESLIAGEIGDVEVYRVHHHGSHNSSNECFLKVLRPEVSIFSTGKNAFGHPDPRVYRALKADGRVFITGGADPKVYDDVRADILEDDVEVIVAPDGKRYWVQGTPFTSRSEAEERARPGPTTCQPGDRPRDPNRAEETGQQASD